MEATPQVEVIVGNLTLVGEGPHYSSRNGGILYYVDIPGKKIGRYDIESGKNTFLEVSMPLWEMIVPPGRGIRDMII